MPPKTANFPPKPCEKHNGEREGANPQNYQTKPLGGVNKGFFNFDSENEAKNRGERAPRPLCYHAGVEKLIYRDGLPVYKILPMREDHLAEVEAIERKSFPYPWSRGVFEAEARNVSGISHPFVLTTNDGRVAGYLCTWSVSNELYVNNIAVAPELRGRGLGRALLEFAEEQARAWGCRVMILEVRASNDAAVHLYEKFGFSVRGVRRRYYEDTDEDAVVMSKALDRPDKG